MNGYYLKNNNKGLYLKNIDTQNETIEFTTKISEAKMYGGGEWYANTELDFAKFHFPQEEEILNEMCCVYEKTY